MRIAVAFVGNIDDSIESVVRSTEHDLFKPLPAAFDLAVLHRFHTYLPGWEIPANSSDMLPAKKSRSRPPRKGRTIRTRPDFTFPEARVVVFVDGCFWHGCPLHGELPATNRRFWQEKLARNRQRDIATRRQLRLRGWKVVRIWQHDLTYRNEGRCLAILGRALRLR